MSLFKTSIPSCLELQILEFANYCPQCDVYDYHAIGTCAQCDDPICRYDAIRKYGKDFICKKCMWSVIRSKRVFTFEYIKK